MEILRQGSTDKIREWEIKHKQVYVLTCEVCGCEFEVKKSDREIHEDQREGKTWVRCPFCKRIVDLN